MEKQKIGKPKDEQAEFVYRVVEDSRQDRQRLEEVWNEVEDNFFMRLPDDSNGGRTDTPLGIIGSRGARRPTDDAILKDPESHQECMTIVSNIVTKLFPDDGFVRAAPVGPEDSLKAQATKALLEASFRKEGMFLNMALWVMSQGIYGTGIVEASWETITENRNVRVPSLNPFDVGGFDVETQPVPVYDGVRLKVVPVRDFYPDRSDPEMQHLQGAAKWFTIPAHEARKRAKAGMYNAAAVERAIEHGITQRSPSDRSRSYEQNAETKINPEFLPLTGYEYTGNVPWKTADGVERRRITVLGGETVRSRAWPRAMPFFKSCLIPRMDSFWGLAPLEVIRYDQDVCDVFKMMITDATVKATHPPHIYAKDADVDVAKLRRFSPKVPIGARDVSSIGQVPYNPPVGAAGAFYQQLKGQMREGTGALGTVMGIREGSAIRSGTEAAMIGENSTVRPEFSMRLIEREYLPPIGRFVLAMHQEFVEDDADLRKRIGDADGSVAKLGDIMGDYDIKFIGSRIEGTRMDDLAADREILAASANPMVGQLIPWIPFLREHFKRLGQHELAAMVGNPDVTQLNIMLNQLGGPSAMNGNGNGNQTAQPQQGMLPAQTLGQAQ